MSKTVAEYYAQLEEIEKRRKQEKMKLADLKKAAEEKQDAAHRKAEAEQIEQHAYERRAAEKPWLVTIIASAGCLVGIAYFLLRLFNANESMEVDRMTRTCIFLGVIILLLIGLGFFRQWLKKKELLQKQVVIDGIVAERKEADEAAASAAEKTAAQTIITAALDKEYRKTEDELFTVHPEEKERIESEKKAAIEQQLKEKAAQEEAYSQMLEDREKRNQELQLAGEMFDMPKKFLREYGGSEMAVYEASAEMGCEEAQCKVVQLYVGAEYMTGVKQDLEKGLALGKKYAGSKKTGSPMVAEIMGELYLFGKGSVAKDPEKAIPWLTQAASCGRRNAMVNLGYSLYTGEGVEQDIEKAKFWFEKAARQGDEQAFKLLEAIKSGAVIRTDGDDFDEE